MTDVEALCQKIKTNCASLVEDVKCALGEITVETKSDHLHALCKKLRDHADFQFDMLVDVCGVDYLEYGLADWETHSVSSTGYERGVTAEKIRQTKGKPARFAVVYHLLSIQKNQRLRVRVYLPDESELIVDSVCDLWSAANWFEREAFDLYGILFRNHPDLRRILTDYGFVGHPFRKDFPLIGEVEARYDAATRRVVYEPVSIEPRILEPKVIRHDSRYVADSEGPSDGN